MTLTELIVGFIFVTIVLAVILANVPTSRAMRAYLVARAMPGAKATIFARSLADRPRLSILDVIGALNQIDSLKRRDRENELLG